MEKLIIISPYPPQGSTYENKYSALASFCKNKVKALVNLQPDLRILVLADIFPGAKSFKEKRVEIKRVWQRGKLSSYFSILKEILKEKEVKKVLLELEWALFGKNPFLLSLVPLLLFVLKVFGRKTFVVLHGVSLDFLSLSKQVGIKQKGFKSIVYSVGMKLFYFFVITFSFKVIVLEQYFADLLNKKFKSKKVVFIPHGVDTSFRSTASDLAKKKLGIGKETFVITSFGFLNWYKGSDVLIKLFIGYLKKNKDKKILLLLAGGESKVHKSTRAYKQFITKTRALAATIDQVKITDFIPEDKLFIYLNASDLFVLPYRLFLSSSGPLSIAFSLEKPILLSESLKNYTKSPDFKSAIKLSNLKINDLFFKSNLQSFSNRLNAMKKNMNNYFVFSKKMRVKRGWQNVVKKYLELLFEENV